MAVCWAENSSLSGISLPAIEIRSPDFRWSCRICRREKNKKKKHKKQLFANMWKGHLGSVENIVLAHPTKGSEILPGVISTMHWPVLYCRCHRGPGSSMLCACWPGVWTFSELNLKKPTSYWDLVSTRNSFSFSYKLSFFGVCFCFCQKGISAQSDFHGLPWHGPGASSRPVCVLGPLPSVTACLSDSPGPGRGDPLQEEVFTRDFPSIWKPDLCLKAIYVPPLFKKKKESLI